MMINFAGAMLLEPNVRSDFVAVPPIHQVLSEPHCGFA